jgi:hypothetical protein
VKERTTFCEKKVAKKLHDTRFWALAAAAATARGTKKFQKRGACSCPLAFSK